MKVMKMTRTDRALTDETLFAGYKTYKQILPTFGSATETQIKSAKLKNVGHVNWLSKFGGWRK